MLARIDIGNAIMMALEVQSIRSYNPFEMFERTPRRASTQREGI